jgi:hypothetical protein
VLGLDAIGSSTVTKYLRQSQIPPIPMKNPEKPHTTIMDDVILDALEQKPFSSVRELAELTCIPRSPVHRHFT